MGCLLAQRSDALPPSLGGKLTIGIVADPTELLHPLRVRALEEKRIADLIFGNSVFRKSEATRNPPNFFNAEASDRSNRLWKIVLRRGIAFHDGNYMSNDDIVFTIELIRKFGGALLNVPLRFDDVVQMKKNGDLELLVELKDGDKLFAERLAQIPILPSHYYADALEQGFAVFRKKAPMGSGPYRWSSSTKDQLRLVFHPNYYAGRPFLQEIRVRFYDNEQQISSALVNDQIDFAELPDHGSANRLHDLMKSKLNVFLVPREATRITFILFNLKSFPLSAKEARRTLHLALNRIDMARGVGPLLNTVMPVEHSDYDRSLFSNDYNPQAAIQMLRDKGWSQLPGSNLMAKEGKPFSFELFFAEKSTLEENLARTILLNLRELNIDVKPIPLPSVSKKERLEQGAFEAMIYSYEYDSEYIYEALEEFYFEILGAGATPVNYRNRYISNIFRIAREGGERESIPQRFQLFVHQEMPAVFLFHEQARVVAVRNRVKGFRTQEITQAGTITRLNPIEEWFIPRELQRGSSNGN